MRQPCVLKGVLHQLPVYCCDSSSACFTQDVTRDWFMKHAVPEIRCHQLQDIKAAPEDGRAVIVTGIAVSYPEI